MMFDAQWIYPSGEPYNAGRGLAVISDDASHLHGLFDLYVQRGGYAVQITDGDKVVREYGSMERAASSLRAAIKLRKNR